MLGLPKHDLCFVWKIPAYASVDKQSLSNTSSATFKTGTNQTHTSESEMDTNNSMSLTLATLQFAIRNSSKFIGLMEYFSLPSRESLVIKSGPAPVFNKLATVNCAFSVIPTGMCIR